MTMRGRRHVVALAVALATVGCSHPVTSSKGSMNRQAGVTNGGLTAGAEAVARRIAIRETASQEVHLMAAVALEREKRSHDSEPRSGSCPTGPLIRVVLEGSFPHQAETVKAEDIYARLYSGRVCSTRYLTALPSLSPDLGTLWVPGTASTGQ